MLLLKIHSIAPRFQKKCLVSLCVFAENARFHFISEYAVYCRQCTVLLHTFSVQSLLSLRIIGEWLKLSNIWAIWKRFLIKLDIVENHACILLRIKIHSESKRKWPLSWGHCRPESDDSYLSTGQTPNRRSEAGDSPSPWCSTTPSTTPADNSVYNPIYNSVILLRSTEPTTDYHGRSAYHVY